MKKKTEKEIYSTASVFVYPYEDSKAVGSKEVIDKKNISDQKDDSKPSISEKGKGVSFNPVTGSEKEIIRYIRSFEPTNLKEEINVEIEPTSNAESFVINIIKNRTKQNDTRKKIHSKLTEGFTKKAAKEKEENKFNVICLSN